MYTQRAEQEEALTPSQFANWRRGVQLLRRVNRRCVRIHSATYRLGSSWKIFVLFTNTNSLLNFHHTLTRIFLPVSKNNGGDGIVAHLHVAMMENASVKGRTVLFLLQVHVTHLLCRYMSGYKVELRQHLNEWRHQLSRLDGGVHGRKRVECSCQSALQNNLPRRPLPCACFLFDTESVVPSKPTHSSSEG